MNIVFISLIESILYYICMLSISVHLLNAKYSKIKICISFLLFIPIILLGFICDKYTMAFIHEIFQIIEIFMVRLCLKKIRIRSIISIYIFLFLINIIVASCIDFFLSLEIVDEGYIEFSVNILSTVICFIVCYSKLNQKVKQVLNLTPKIIKRLLLALLVCCSILTVFVLYDSFYIDIANYSNAVKLVLVIFIILLSFAMPILVLYSITNKHIKNLADNYEKQINAQFEYYTLLSESNFELRRFRHDYKNMCIGLSKLISEGNNNDALEMLEKQNLIFNSSFIKYDTGNGIVDALLTDKQKQADKINAQIAFEGAVPPHAIKPTDLCVIFGNTLDNALEACNKIDPDVLKVIFVSCVCNSGFMFIKITNPVAQKVTIDGNIPTTTKADKNMHGFGLYSLDKIIKQYDGMVSFECDDNTFQISIEFSIYNEYNKCTDSIINVG